MKKQMKRWIAVGMAAVLLLQAVQIENFGDIREVYAVQTGSREEKRSNSGEGIPEGENTEAEQNQATEEKMAEESANPTAEMGEASESTEGEIAQTQKEAKKAAARTSLNGMVLQELTAENGVIEGDYSITIPSRLTGDLVVKGNLNIYQPLALNGHSLVVEGDVNQFSELAVTGDFIVYGNYQWTDGNLTLDRGYMDIEKSMQVLYVNGKLLTMGQEEDYLLVKGDIQLEASNQLGTDITAGILELRGDFIQKVYTNDGRITPSKGDFLMTGDSTLLLSGEDSQNIYVSKESSGFEHIVVSTANLEQDEEGNYIFDRRRIGFSGYYHYKTYEDNGCPTTYGCAEYSEIPEGENIIYGSCYYTGEPLHLKNRNLIIIGDFIQDADVHLEGGGLSVYGDYRIQSVQGEEKFGETAALMDCTKGGYVYVYGDFITQSVTDHTGYLSAGTWYLYAGLYQMGENAKNFATSKDFKIYGRSVTGNSKERHIVMDNPLGNPIVDFYSISEEALSFDNGVCIDRFNYPNPYSGTLYLRTGQLYGQYRGDVTVVSDAGDASYLTVEGNLTIQSDISIRTTVTVKKNVYVESGTVSIEGELRAGDVIFRDGSDSALKMEQAASAIKCTNFYYGSNRSSENLSNGEIDVTGDFYVKDTGTPDSFVCSGEHKVVTSGSEGIQKVTVENKESCLEILYVSNGNGGMTRATEGTVIHTIRNQSYSYIWEGIEGYTLEQDMVYDEDLILAGGTLDLNGHTLTVNGDFYAEGGTLCINGGHLIVTGDLNCAYRDWTTGEVQLERSNIDIIMEQENDRITIGGDWYAIFITHSLKNMTKGTVSLSGNMNIEGSVGSVYSSAEETIFCGTGLCLTGTKKQSVTGVSKSIRMQVGNLEITNESKVEIELPIQVDGMLLLPEKLNYQFYSLTLQDLDNISGHHFKGDLTVKQSTLSGDVTIEGDLSIIGKTDLCGYHIYAGNITVDAETVLSGGGLHTDTLYMNQKIVMKNESDIIEAQDMEVQVKNSDSDYMTAGNIYITGNFNDVSSYYSTESRKYAFLPSGSHTITFMKPDATPVDRAGITFYGSDSRLNRAVLVNKLNCYTLNREKEDIANELILGYEDSEKPTVPQNLTCTGKNCYSVSLKWDESEDNMEVYRYKIYRNGQYVGKTGDTAYTDTILNENVTYRYNLTAVDGAGNESDRSEVLEVTTPADENPPVYRRSPEFRVAGDEIRINCNGAYQDQESYVDHYIITKDGEEIASVQENAYVSYQDHNNNQITKCVHIGRPYYSETGLEYGRTYQFGVSAVDAAGNRSEESVKTVMADLPPEAPEQFSVISENGYNTISFEQSGNAGCSYYGLYRGGTLIETFSNDSRMAVCYVDKGVSVGSTYQYYIIPYSRYGTAGEKTEKISVKTIKESIPPTIDEITYSIPGDIFNEEVDIKVTASDNSGLSSIYAYLTKEGEQRVEIYRVTLGEYATSCTEDFTFSVDNRKGVYDLHIVAVDHCGNETEVVKTCRIQVAGIEPVKVLSATADITSVHLSWETEEDAAYYVVEQKIGDKYQWVGRTYADSLTVNRLESEREYSFRIVAYDKEGIRGLATEDITVKTRQDTVEPVISKVYAKNSVLGISAPLKIEYWDNEKVEKVRAYYRQTGTSDWIAIGEKTVNRQTGDCDLPWDKTGLLSGNYDVLYQAVDRSGNRSEDLILTYILDLDGPVISNFCLIPGNWTIRLEWDEVKEADYAGFKIKRMTKSRYEAALEQEQDPFWDALTIRQGSKNHYYEEEISPKEEYVYQLLLYDCYGNVTASVISGQAVDKDVQSPEVAGLPPMFAAKDIAISLSAGDCKDNDGIASYRWDMGNGDVVYGQNCEYTYMATGTYRIELQVKDHSGNETTAATMITVGKDSGTVDVTVMSGGKPVPNADVALCMNGRACHNSVDPQTDNRGKLTMPVGEGTYQIAAYKEGYQPYSTEVTVKKGEKSEIVINLEKGEFVEASFTTKEMTYEEMKKAGIEPKENQVVFQYDVKLDFGKDKIGTSISINSEKPSVTYYYHDGAYTILPAETSDEKSKKSESVTVSNVSDDPSKPVIMITRIVPVTISWMKNIYEVEVTICNQAGEEFSLEDTIASLNLPDGLEPAVMKKKGKNSADWEIGTLKGGEQKSHTWYVSGSKTGSYPLKVELNAVMQPFNLRVHKTMISERMLDVTVGKGLHLYVFPEESAYIDETYYVQFQLKNESDMDYHNVTTSFGNYDNANIRTESVVVLNVDGKEDRIVIGNNSGIDYYDPNDGNTDSGFSLQTGDTLKASLFKPKRVLYGTFAFTFNAQGDSDREYYPLLTEYLHELKVNNTDMEVTIQPIRGHLQKSFTSITVTHENRDTENKNTENNRTPATDSSSQTVKDPIDLMTGAFTVNHVVAAVSGGTELLFDMNYNSLYTEAAGELGKGWYHNYEMKLERNGSMVILHPNPYEMLYFAESEETADTVCGTVEGNTIILEDDSMLERTYYQAGSDSKQCYIVKNKDGYTLFSGQEQYQFDKSGTLTGYQTEDGRKVVIQKSEDLLTITDKATGKSITASYDEEGRIHSVTDAAGQKTTLEYDNDCMTVLTSKTGKKLVYEYDGQGHIIKGKEGEDSVYVENTYDEAGRVLSQTVNGNQDKLTRFAYIEDADSGTTSVTMTNPDGTTEQAVSDRYGQGLRYVNAIGGVTEYAYNRYYKMTGCRYPDGTGKSYSYDENGNIVKIEETTGRITDYSYDDSGRVTHMRCNDGTDIRYAYNEGGQLASVTGGNGLKASYTYNEDGQILTETSALGTISYAYEKGMLHALTDYSGNTHFFAYDANGNVVQYTDGAGIRTDYKVDASGRVTEESVAMEDGRKATVSYTYDGYGNMLTKTDALGNTTSYIYDEEDRLAEEKRPDGTSFTYTYDDNGNITKITCPDGETTAEAVYDAAGNAISLTDTLKGIQTASYSAGSQLLSMVQGNGGEITYTYYENGLLESQTDANGNTAVLAYDDAGRITRVTDGAGDSTVFGYDKDGNLASVENALGNSTKLEYNEYRKIVRQTDGNGSVTKYDYDKALNCTRITDAEGGVTEFAYDAGGQIISMTRKGDTEKEDVSLSMEYDNLGNVTALTDGEGNTRRMEYDLNSSLTAVYDAKGVKTESYAYDCLGRCIEVTDAFGSVTKNSYDAMGNLIKQMNEGTGSAVTYSYVGGRYLASSMDAMGNTAGAAYDSMGNIETLTNPNGGVTSYRYDLNNNLTDEIIGEDYHVRYTYNAKDLAASKTNSRNQKTAYEYDALGRLIKQSDEAGVIEYAYDANDNVLTVTETAGDRVSRITRTYDRLNRITSYEDAAGNQIGYTYDRLGNLVKLTYPDGKAVTYTYDKNGSIKTVTDWNNRVTVYSYDENGRLVKTKRPDGTIETRAYDKAGRLISILDKCGDTVVNQQEYSYDASGNITTVKALESGSLDFKTVASAEMTYDVNNRLLTYNGEEVKYDKDGNMTYGPLQGKMEEFVYDCRNRLVKAGDTSYEYDAENNRTAVITGTKRTEYVVNSQPELSQILQSRITDGEREETTYYLYGKGLLSQENVTGGYLTYHFNNVGSTMAVTDQDGKVKYSYHYTPYGELLKGEYSDTVPFLYNGQFGVTTDGNGLYYMRARYYNVDIKRFINQDVLTGTLERVSSLNRYAYVEGNPVSFLDPFGLDKWIYDELHSWVSRVSFVFNTAAILFGFSGTPAVYIFNAFMMGFDFGVYISEFVNNDYDWGILMDGFTNVVINAVYYTFGYMSDQGLISNTIGIASDVAAYIKSFFETVFSY
ncbi:MAG: PEGA domain-containing protein [Lachnospiraceae bacterium]|nr:PEGA domain-containing protein [Lachnospiraceae bacterium]